MICRAVSNFQIPIVQRKCKLYQFLRLSQVHLRLLAPFTHSWWSGLDNRNACYIFPVSSLWSKSSFYVFCGLPSFLQNVRETFREKPQLLLHLSLTVSLILWLFDMVMRIGKRTIHPLAFPAWAMCLSSPFPSVQSKVPFYSDFFFVFFNMHSFLSELRFLSWASKVRQNTTQLSFLSYKGYQPGTPKSFCLSLV